MIKINPMLIPGLKKKKPLPNSNAFREKVIDVVTKEFGIPRHQIFFKCRKLPIVTCRHVAMFLIRTHESHTSLKDIGRYFGGRDHTTVIHSMQTIKNLMHTDETLRQRVKKIESLI